MVLVPYRSISVFSLGGWTPHLPAGLACPAVLVYSLAVRLRDSHPFSLAFPDHSAQPFACGLLRFRSPLLAESFLFLGLLGCFGSPGSLYYPMNSDSNTQPCRCVGFPIRTPPVCSVAHTSPELFAVYRVLHRHLSPSHSLCALVASL